MSTPAANRAYEDRFREKHGMSRGAWRWHNGNLGAYQKALASAEPETWRGVPIAAEGVAASRARPRYRALARLRRSEQRMAEMADEMASEGWDNSGFIALIERSRQVRSRMSEAQGGRTATTKRAEAEPQPAEMSPEEKVAALRRKLAEIEAECAADR